MKEATGELSMTAIVVVILGVIAVAAPIIINTVSNSLKGKVACQASYGCDTCGSDGRQTCYYMPDPDDKKPIGTPNGETGDYKITCSCKAS